MNCIFKILHNFFQDKKEEGVAALASIETNTNSKSCCWSDLPDDVLEHIFRSKKIELIDLLRFRDVCKSWKSVININMAYHRHHLSILKSPTLFIGCYNNRLESKVYRLKVPGGDQFHDYMYSSGPWILKYCLAPKNFPHNLRIFHCLKDMEIELPNNPPSGFVSPLKFRISTINDIMVVLLIDGKGKSIAFCELNSQGKRIPECSTSLTWMEIDFRDFLRERIGGSTTFTYDDVVIHGKHIYLLPSEGCSLHLFRLNILRRDEWDLEIYEYYHREVRFISEPNDLAIIGGGSNKVLRKLRSAARRYWVKTSPMMVVIRYVEYWEYCGWKGEKKYYCCKTKYFEVINAHTAETVESLNSRAIFLARYDSRIVPASKVNCNPNCIYFVDDALEGIHLSSECDSGVYNLETKTIERFCNAPFNRWLLIMDSKVF